MSADYTVVFDLSPTAKGAYYVAGDVVWYDARVWWCSRPSVSTGPGSGPPCGSCRTRRWTSAGRPRPGSGR